MITPTKHCSQCGRELSLAKYFISKTVTGDQVNTYYYKRCARCRKDSVPAGMRRCNECQQIKPLEGFAWLKRAQGKRHYQCKKCMSTAAQKRQSSQRSKTDSTPEPAPVDSSPQAQIDRLYADRRALLKIGETRPLDPDEKLRLKEIDAGLAALWKETRQAIASRQPMHDDYLPLPGQEARP